MARIHFLFFREGGGRQQFLDILNEVVGVVIRKGWVMMSQGELVASSAQYQGLQSPARGFGQRLGPRLSEKALSSSATHTQLISGRFWGFHQVSAGDKSRWPPKQPDMSGMWRLVIYDSGIEKSQIV